MTKKENLTIIKNIITLAQDNGFELPEEYSFDELTAFVDNELSLLEKKAERAKVLAAEKRKEGDELRETVYNLLSDTEFMTVNEIVRELNDDSISANKVISRLTQLINLEMVQKDTISIKTGDDEKTKKVTAYKRV